MHDSLHRAPVDSGDMTHKPHCPPCVCRMVLLMIDVDSNTLVFVLGHRDAAQMWPRLVSDCKNMTSSQGTRQIPGRNVFSSA